jgi:mannose/fructose/sorbose-specific phosphotransferase system IIA component
MEKVIIITHGNYGEELLKSVEMIAGKQENGYAFSINEDTNIDDIKKQVGELIEGDTYIFVDIYGGSPFNCAISFLSNPKVRVISGFNMPMILEFFVNKNRDVETMIEDSRKSISFVNEEMKG